MKFFYYEKHVKFFFYVLFYVVSYLIISHLFYQHILQFVCYNSFHILQPTITCFLQYKNTVNLSNNYVIKCNISGTSYDDSYDTICVYFFHFIIILIYIRFNYSLLSERFSYLIHMNKTQNLYTYLGIWS